MSKSKKQPDQRDELMIALDGKPGKMREVLNKYQSVNTELLHELIIVAILKKRIPVAKVVAEYKSTGFNFIIGEVVYNQIIYSNHSPLSLAAMMGDKEMVEDLVGIEGIDVNLCSPIYHASAQDRGDKIVKILVKHGGNPDQTLGENDDAPLHVAAQLGLGGTIKVLLAANANPFVTKYNGPNHPRLTPAQVAKTQGFRTIEDILLKRMSEIELSRGISGSSSGVATSLVGSKSNLHITTPPSSSAIVIAQGVNPKPLPIVSQQDLLLALQGDDTERVRELLRLEQAWEIIAQITSGMSSEELAGKKYKKYWEKLIRSKINLNAPLIGNSGATPLFMAAWNNSEGLLKALVALGANPKTPANGNTTPLFIASQKGYGRIVRILIGFGVDLNVTNAKGETALFAASALNHLAIVEELINASANPCIARNEDRFTPLEVAACNDVIKRLLADRITRDGIKLPSLMTDKILGKELRLKWDFQGLQLGSGDSDERMVAAFRSALKTNDLVLSSSRSKIESGWSKFEDDMRENAAKVGEKLIKDEEEKANATKSSSKKALSKPTAKNVAAAPVSVLSGDNSVILPNEDDIINAVRNGSRSKLIKILELAPHLLKTSDQSGQTLLHLAIAFDYGSIVTLLAEEFLKNKININCKDSMGNTPIHLAVKMDHIHLVSELAQNFKANTNIEDNAGMVPIATAVANGNIAMVRELKNLNANLNPQHQILTHVAAMNARAQMITELVKLGVPLDLVDAAKQTVLTVALNQVEIRPDQNFPTILQIIFLGFVPNPEEMSRISKNNSLYIAIISALTNEMIRVNLLPDSAEKKHRINSLTLPVKAFFEAEVRPSDEEVDRSFKEICSRIFKPKTRIHELKVAKDSKREALDAHRLNIELFYAARVGDEDRVRELLGSGANANGEGDAIPLITAAYNGHGAVVKMLLEAKADPYLKNKKGWAGLSTAAYRRNAALAVFLEAGLKPEAFIYKSSTPATASQSSSQNQETPNVKIIESGQQQAPKTKKTTFRPHSLEWASADDNEGEIAKQKNIALLYAIRRGDEDRVRELLRLGADVNGVGAYIPLITAAYHNHEGVVNLLLEAGANANLQNDKGWTALTSAFHNENIVKALLEAGADPHLLNRDGKSAFQIALDKCNMNVISEFLSRGIAPVMGQVPPDLYMPIIIFLIESLDCIRFLPIDDKTHYFNIISNNVTNFINLASNSSDPQVYGFGYSLYRAYNLQFDEIHSDQLPAHQIIFSTKSAEEQTYQNILGTINFIIESGNEFALREMASFNDNLRYYLVIKDPQGLTPLHRAIAKGDVPMATALLEIGVNPNLRDYQGKSPLDYLEQQTEVTEAESRLIFDLKKIAGFAEFDFSPPPSTQNRESEHDGWELENEELQQGVPDEAAIQEQNQRLHLCAKQGKMEEVSQAIEAGANIDSPDHANHTPLHLAAREGHLDVVVFLATNNATLDPVNKDGHTPLHLAVLRNRVDVTEYLLQLNADYKIKAKHGDGIFHFAAANNNEDMMTRLINLRRDDLNTPNENGNTPLDIAIKNNYTSLIKLMREKGAKSKQDKTPKLEVAEAEVTSLLLKQGVQLS